MGKTVRKEDQGVPLSTYKALGCRGSGTLGLQSQGVHMVTVEMIHMINVPRQ